MKQLAHPRGLLFPHKMVTTDQTIAQADNNQNFASATELTFALTAGTWHFKGDLYLVHNNASARNIKSAALFSGTTSSIIYSKRSQALGGTTSTFQVGVLAWDDSVNPLSGVNTNTQWHSVEGTFIATSSGNFSLRFGKAVSNFTTYLVTCKAGSRLHMFQVA